VKGLIGSARLKAVPQNVSGFQPDNTLKMIKGISGLSETFWFGSG
jgi:hypothetical protein